MSVIANDDGKKMVERDEAQQFVEEYTRVTGLELTLVGVSERPVRSTM